MMTPEQFTYWLQGFFELSESTQLSPKQVQMIKDHLNLVFVKKTPTVPQPSTVDINKAYEGFRKQSKKPWQDKDFNEAAKDFEELHKPRFYCSTGITASGSNDTVMQNKLIRSCNPNIQYPQIGVSCGLRMPETTTTTTTKQFGCTICERLGHKCASCSTFGQYETFVKRCELCKKPGNNCTGCTDWA